MFKSTAVYSQMSLIWVHVTVLDIKDALHIPPAPICLHWFLAMSCSVLQCVAVCCSVLQCVKDVLHIPPAPMNHAKYLRAGPHEMPLRNWYNCGTNHFHLTGVVWWKWRTQPDWVIKPVTHDLVRRIRFWRIKIAEHDFKYLYWTISKMLSWNICTGR